MKNIPLIQYLSALLNLRAFRGQKVLLEYVRGHAGIEGNEGADALANRGALLPSLPEPDWDARRLRVEAKIAAGRGGKRERELGDGESEKASSSPVKAKVKSSLVASFS